jgi:gliding motility-associated-like protein
MKFFKFLLFTFFPRIKILFFFTNLFFPCVVLAQTDKEFWFVAPNVYDAGRDFNKPITLRITTLSSPATVNISLPADPSFTPITRNVGANSTITVDLTAWIDKLQNTPANTTLNKGLVIKSTADITAYYEVVSGYCNCNPEIFSLKGKNALGTEFFISSQYTYSESTAYSAATNSFDVVATKNNTHVTINPTKDIIGHNANIPFTVVLNEGQTYSAVAVSGSAGGHLQGSYVSSDNPIAVTLKDDLVQVSTCADLIGDQAVPTNVLGTEYVVTKGYLSFNDEIYILAVENGTSVYVDGNSAPTAVLARGQSFTISLTNLSTYIRADKKIYVYHLTGNGCEVGSAVIPKLNCTGSRSVSIVRSNPDLFAVLITTKNGNQNSFTVNGDNTLIKSSDFFPVPGTGGAYVTSRINLSGTVAIGSALNFSNATGNFSLGFINGGSTSGTLYGFFSDFKSSNVQKSSLEVCPSGSVQLSAYGGVSYKWAPATGLNNANISNPTASPAATTDYTVEITSADGCIDYATVHVEVTGTLTPGVSIVASANDICPGASVTFTASPINGGNSPIYQWQVNGVNTGANSPTLTSNALVNGDKVTCTMTSDVCASSASVISNVITMNVSAQQAASVSITSSQNNVCAGVLVNFTAMPVNGGSVPAYQWLVNGISAGANSPVFSSSALVSGDRISCVMTSNADCTAPNVVTSNVITMNINNTIPASVTVSVSKNNVCTGTAIKFTAAPVNGGSSAVYQWMVNGVNAGTNSDTFTSSTLINGDKVSCDMISNAQCATPALVSSNSITMVINAYVTPSISISTSTKQICLGNTVTFTASAINGGATPAYQWMLNGSGVGSNSALFSSNTLANGDVIECILTSNADCSTIQSVNSNSITVKVNAPVTPSVTISVSQNSICYGTSVTFTAMTINHGNSPAYQWLINGIETGTDSDIFISSSTKANDVVSCRLITDAPCAVPTVVTSNTIVMVVNQPPVVDAGDNKVIEKGNHIRLNATVSGNIADITWSPSSGLDNAKILTPNASPVETISYTLTVQSTEGCISTDVIEVTVQNTIAVPNTFTPNDDGTNDKWEIKNLADYTGCSVKVFNRWGQEVFQSRGYYNAWDGTKNGKRLPVGTYFYIINLDKNASPISGYVALLR